MKAVWKREMQGYFFTVIGYVFLGVFLAASSILFYLEILKPRNSNLPYFVSDMSFLWMLVSPILTMRLLAEERQKKTDQLLLTSPVSLPGIVLGKYLAAVAVLLLAAGLSLVYALIVTAYGTVYPAELAVNYLGFILTGCAFISLDLFLSGCVATPAAAAAAAFGANFFLWILDELQTRIQVPWIEKILAFISLNNRNKPMTMLGQLGVSAVFFDVAFAAVFLILTVYILNRRRSRRGWYRMPRGEGGPLTSRERMAGLAGAVRNGLKWKQISGALWAALPLLAAASCVFLSIGADALEKRNGWTADFSFNHVTTHNEVTKELVVSIPRDVHIWALFRKGEEELPLTQLLDRYAAGNDRITWEQADPALNPELVYRFSTLSEVPEEGGMIVYCGETGRWRIVAPSDYAVWHVDPETGEISAESLKYERSITAAIDYVTKDRIPQAVIVQGHGELDEETLAPFVQFLTLNRYEVVYRDLQDPAYEPDPMDLLMFFSPVGDLTGDELEKLGEFAGRGGSFLFTRDFTDPTGSMPNYTALLRSYGFSCLDGIVKEELSGEAEGMCLDNNPAYLIPEMCSTDITMDLIASGTDRVLLPNASAFEMPEEETDRNLTVGVVLRSSRTSYMKRLTDLAGTRSLEELFSRIGTDDRSEGDAAGPFALALQARRVTADGFVSRAFIIGCSPALTNQDSLTILAGQQLIIRTMEFLLDLDASDLKMMEREIVRPALGVMSTRPGAVVITLLPAAVLLSALLVLAWRRKR